MPRVLDLDLDFFLNRVTEAHVGWTERQPDAHCRPWLADEVRHFLEYHCGLQRGGRVRAGLGVHHHQAFRFWEEMITSQRLAPQFDLFHIDAHADLGVFAQAADLLERDVLRRPLEARTALPEGTKRLNPGNYLLFAIACRWVRSLTYVTHPEWDMSDLPLGIFVGRKPADTLRIHEDARAADQKLSGIPLAVLEKYERSREHREYIASLHGESYARPEMKFEYATCEGTIHLAATPPIVAGEGAGDEPPVPFFTRFGVGFREHGPWDCVFLSQSPAFTPKASDALIDVILEYVEPIWGGIK